MPERRPLDLPDVEELLAELAGGLEWPMLPDAVGAARNRLAAGERAKRREGGARWLAWAAVAVVVVIVVSLALPGPRGAVADLFGLGGVQIRQVTTTVPLPPPTTLDLGPASSLDEAPLEVPFQIYVPTAVEGPPQVFTDWVAGRRVLSLVYPPSPDCHRRRAPRSACWSPSSPARWSPSSTRSWPATRRDGSRSTVGRRCGSRAPTPSSSTKVVTWSARSQPRLAANTLVVTRGNTTIRLEGAFDEATAIELARSLEPLT